MPDILISNEGPVRKIRMNRAEKKNALTLAMYETMASTIEDAGKSDSVKCLIIAGAPDVFCAGNDLNDFVTMARAGGLATPIIRFLRALARCEKPLVAAVSGAAVGVGTTMLLHCDHVIASDSAVLLTPFVSLGLVPEGGSSLIAPRLMRGSVEEIVARIDEEVEAFKTRLASPEAQKALAAFLTRKR